VAKSIVTGIVDRRFASIPKFATIRVFQHLSKVSQWTGAEQKYILRQILPVFVPLLEEVGTPEANAAIQFIRATVDFITLAMYQSHDDNTLRYLELALYRMNQRKEVFQKYRNPKAKDDEQHFDFPKWHSLTHYVQMIRLYGCAPNWDTNHPEHKHHTYANEGFRRTNKKNDWEDQLMEHHLRGINMLALQDTLCRGPRPTLADGRERDEEPVSVGEPQPIDLVFGLPGINRRTKKALWRPVRDIVELLGPEEGPLFRQAMAVFVRESRPYNREQPSNLDPDRVEPMDTWVNDYPVQLHHSIKCRKEHGDMTDDSSTTERNITRWARSWQREVKPRHDWVWVQEYEATAEDGKQSVAFQGRSPVRPRLIVTVEDIGVIHAAEHDMDQGEQANTRYSGVYCDVYVPKDPQGRASDVHGMTLIKPLPLWQLGQGKHHGLHDDAHRLHPPPLAVILATVRANSKPDNAAKVFFAEAGRFAQDLVTAHGGDKDVVFEIITFEKHCFTIKDEDKLEKWDDEQIEIFRNDVLANSPPTELLFLLPTGTPPSITLPRTLIPLVLRGRPPSWPVTSTTADLGF
jgi:hypothetical protein